MAGKFDNTRENTDSFEDTGGFDLDLELNGLTSFLHEMGVELEDEPENEEETGKVSGDEITGLVSFDFSDEKKDDTGDILENFLFGLDGDWASPDRTSDGEQTPDSEEWTNSSVSPEGSDTPDFLTDREKGADGFDTESAYSAEDAENTPDTGDMFIQDEAADVSDTGEPFALDNEVDALDTDTLFGMKDVLDTGEPFSLDDEVDALDTDALFGMKDVSDTGEPFALDSEEDTLDTDDAFDLDDLEDTYGLEAAEGADAYDAEDDEDSHDAEAAASLPGTETTGVPDAKELKKAEKKVDRVLKKTFGKPFSWKRELLSWVAMFVIAFTLAYVIDNYLIVNATVPTGSMQNTIMAGDRMIGWRLSYLFSEPERGDIIIFEYPDNPEEIYVKRVIGLPGETVTITDGKIYINDSTEPLEEDYLPEEWVWKNTGYTFVVPEDSYLCLGDNRNNSHDARSWTNTYVTKDAILGQAVLCYWPTDDFGWLN